MCSVTEPRVLLRVAVVVGGKILQAKTTIQQMPTLVVAVHPRLQVGKLPQAVDFVLGPGWGRSVGGQ